MHLGLALICRQRHLKNVVNNNSDKGITIYYKRGFIDDKIQDSQDFKTSVPKSKTQTYQYYNPYNQINVNMLSFSFPYIPWLLHCNVLKRHENNHTQIAILTTITLSYSTSTPWWNSKSQTLKTLKEVHHFASQIKGLENFNIWPEICITLNFSSYHSPFLTRGDKCTLKL